MRILLALAGCGGGCAGGAARAPSGRTPVDTHLSNHDIIGLLYLTRRDDVDIRAVTVSGTGLATCRSALATRSR